MPIFDPDEERVSRRFLLGISNWETIVGNVGTVYSGTNGFDARKCYLIYVDLSKRTLGRASGEEVTLFRDGEIYLNYPGTLSEME